jgi:hypothetical protein
MFKLKFYIISIVVLSLNMSLASWAKDSKSKFLPKTEDTKSDDKKSSNEDSKDSMDDKSADDVNDSEEEEQVIDDPDESFKLIAIYLVGNNPRGLIKNLDKPEDPAKEFQVGDYVYVDELKAFLISKILLNPTARIELVDPNGLSYVIKTKNTDSTKIAQPSKSKYLPSYLSGSNKVKIKRAAVTTAPTTPATDTSSAPVKPSEKKDEATSLESAIKTDTSSQTTTPSPSNPPPAPTAEQPQNPPPQQPASQGIQTTSTGTSQTNTATPPPAAKTDSMMATSGGAVDTSRPSNPFGE